MESNRVGAVKNKIRIVDIVLALYKWSTGDIETWAGDRWPRRKQARFECWSYQAGQQVIVKKWCGGYKWVHIMEQEILV